MTNEQKTCCYQHPIRSHGLANGCQFSQEKSVRSNLTTISGKSYCRFHLPIAAGKSEWTRLEIVRFNEIVNERLCSTEYATSGCDLRGVVFPNDFKCTKSVFNEARFEHCHFCGVADFSSVTFRDECDFSNVRFEQNANFDSAKFIGRANFFGARLEDGFSFKSTTFNKQSSFSECVYKEKNPSYTAQFDQTKFHNVADFQSANFHAPLQFDNAQFQDQTLFVGTKFWDRVWFANVEFHNPAHFDDSYFANDAWFRGTTFHSSTNFLKSTFAGEAMFMETNFLQRAVFDKVRFIESAFFDQSESETRGFSDISFIEATFKNELCFLGRDFNSRTSFQATVFSQAPVFHGCTLHQDTIFPPIENFLDTGGDDAARAYRTLRLAMKQQEAHAEEAMFWALEQRSKRNEDSNWFPWALSWGYDLVSEYGLNAAYPLGWLAVWVVYSTLIYGCISGTIEKLSSMDHWLGALTFSIAQMARPFFIWGDYDNSNIKAALGSDEFTFLIKILATVDSLVSLTLIALFILAVRRRFRMQ